MGWGGHVVCMNVNRLPNKLLLQSATCWQTSAVWTSEKIKGLPEKQSCGYKNRSRQMQKSGIEKDWMEDPCGWWQHQLWERMYQLRNNVGAWTWIAGDATRFYSLSLDMSIIGCLMRDIPCALVSFQELNKWLAQLCCKSISGLKRHSMVHMHQISQTDPIDLVRRASFPCFICFKLCGSATVLMDHLKRRERRDAEVGVVRL